MIEEIKHVGVVGTGRMGPEIFQLVEDRGYRTTLLGRSASALEEARHRFLKTLDFAHKEEVITEEEFISRKERASFTTDAGDLADCDLIIEAIGESASAKRELFQNLDAVIKAEAIFTSCSSSITPKEYAPSPDRAQRTFGLHFFYPPKIIGIVEIVRSPSSDKDVQNVLTDFCGSLDKTHMLETDEEPFLINRTVLPFQAQAYRFVEDGRASFAQVDHLVRDKLGMPGVFELFDRIGIDVAYRSVARYIRMQPTIEPSVKPLETVLKRLSDQKRKGVKTQAGFFNYEDGKVVLSEEPGPLPEPLEEECLKRLHLLLLNQVYYFVDRQTCLESDIESAVEEAYGVDVGIRQSMNAEDLHEFGRQLDLIYRETGEEVFRPNGALVGSKEEEPPAEKPAEADGEEAREDGPDEADKQDDEDSHGDDEVA